MKKVFGLSVAITFATLSCASIVFSLPSTELERLVVEAGAKDFGTLKQGQVVKHTFDLINRSNGELSIRTVLRNCDCSAVDVGRSKVEPGGHCPVEITWDTKGRADATSSTVRVVYALAADPADTKEVELRMSGDIVPPVRCLPPRLSFDPSAAPQVQTVAVVPEPGEEARVVEAVVNHPALTTEVVDARSVRIKFDPVALGQAPPEGGAKLFVKTTNKTDPEHIVPIDWETPRRVFSGR